jgi:hypothetical protein
MVIFLYLGIVGSILLILIMYGIDNIKMRLKKIPPKDRINYMKNKLPIRMLIACSMVIFISLIVPGLIWQIGEKERSTGSKVIDSASLDFLPNVSGSYYIGQENVDNENIYVFKLLGTQYTTLQKSSATNTDTVTLVDGEQPKYENIQIYSRVRLKLSKASLKGIGSKISYYLLDNVNNIFVDNSGWKQHPEKKKIKLFVPKDSIAKDYGVQTQNDSNNKG